MVLQCLVLIRSQAKYNQVVPFFYLFVFFLIFLNPKLPPADVKGPAQVLNIGIMLIQGAEHSTHYPLNRRVPLSLFLVFSVHDEVTLYIIALKTESIQNFEGLLFNSKPLTTLRFKVLQRPRVSLIHPPEIQAQLCRCCLPIDSNGGEY